MKKLLVFLLSGLLAANISIAQEKPKANAAGVGVAIVVVCVGGYCVYKVVKFCQRKFPKDKPPSTNELASVQQDNEDEFGASWNYGAIGSCLQPGLNLVQGLNATNYAPTTFVLNISIRNESKVEVSMRAAADEFQDWGGFQADMAAHGLTVTGIPDNSQFFSRNRQPVSAGEVPIVFDDATKTVTVSSGSMVRVVVERSLDLTTWEPLLSVRQPAGSRFQVLDTSTESSAFYRTSILP